MKTGMIIGLSIDYMYCQTGYGVSEDGTGFVCNTTYMPGVSGEMLDWWFPWHSVESDPRYKIWYPCEDGVMLCSRFWIGYGIINGEIKRALPPNAVIPEFVPRGLFAHNIKEFSNLSDILPELYDENSLIKKNKMVE